MIFSAKTLTPASTPTFLASNLSAVKSLGQILYFFALLRFVLTLRYLIIKSTRLNVSCWNGFPTKVRNFLIKKLKAKLCNNNIILHGNNENNDDSVPKIWLKLPYLGRQGEFLVKKLIRKVRRSLKVHVKIIVVYQTKKTPFFLPNKDKIPDPNKANVFYKFSCPGSGHSYVGKTD